VTEELFVTVIVVGHKTRVGDKTTEKTGLAGNHITLQYCDRIVWFRLLSPWIMKFYGDYRFEKNEILICRENVHIAPT